MNRLIKSTTALSMSLALTMPTHLIAQADFPDCQLDGSQLLFPCVVEREVFRQPEELATLIENRGATSEDTQTTTTEQDDERIIAPSAQEETEAERIAAEQAQAQAEEAARIAAEQAAAEEAARIEAEQAAAQDAERAAAEQVERDRIAAEQAAADEAARVAAAQAQAQADAGAAAQLEADRAALEEERRAAREEELAAAAAAAAAAEAGNAEAAVVTEEVTEDQVRASDEEFETGVTGQQAANSGDDDGLSKFEKALLLGLGAVVVGSILKNGDKVVSRSGDRVVVEDPNGDLRVLKDDDALIRRPGDEVRTETFDDGSSRNIVTKPDGSRIVTIRGRDGTVLRRVSIDAQGNEYVLFDDLQQEEQVVVNELPQVQQNTTRVSTTDEDALRAALQAELNAQQQGRFSLRQVREIKQVRALAPELELDAVRFATGSAAIQPEQARSLASIGRTLSELIARDPRTVILVEGHTDAVGDATYNLALSDRRAETVALALTEYFDVPPENMITQGYGEAALKVPTLEAEPANRRAVVRNITSLLR